MVTFRSISIELRSQYDLLVIPEFAPRVSEDGSTSSLNLKDGETSHTSVFIPIYSSSQFWLCYAISPPHPPASYFYFKLIIDGVHVVSWGCGKEDDYKGKTMYGLFENKKASGQRPDIVKRAFFFSRFGMKNEAADPSENNRLMEIKVFRSSGRKKDHSAVDRFTKSSRGQVREDGIELRNAGRLEHNHPQEYYKYALLDPTDTPFAVFRYFYRTWEQLNMLGVTNQVEHNAVIAPTLSDSPVKEQPLRPVTKGWSIQSPGRSKEYCHAYGEYQQRGGRNDQYGIMDGQQTKRLSIPPSIQPAPGGSRSVRTRPKPMSAHHGASSRDDKAEESRGWLFRSPSPAAFPSRRYSSPVPSPRKKTDTASFLTSVVRQAIRRPTASSSDGST